MKEEILKGVSMNCLKCLQAIAETDPKQHGLHEACFREWFQLTAPVDFAAVTIRTTTSSATKNKDSFSRINSSFFHGKFKKYSATLGNVSYILKVKDGNFLRITCN